MVEAALLRQLLAILAKENAVNADESRYGVFIYNLAKDNEGSILLYRIHGNDAHVRSLGVLGPPIIVFRIAVDHVPAKVVHGYHLWRQIGFLSLGPYDVPLVVVFHDLQIAAFVKGPDRGSPCEVRPDDSFVTIPRDYSRL